VLTRISFGVTSGWTPVTWRIHLLYLADCCHAGNPCRAAELRRAAVAMTPTWREMFEERTAIMEYDGGLPWQRAEVAALDNTLGLPSR